MRGLIIIFAVLATACGQQNTINPPECGQRPYGSGATDKVVGGSVCRIGDWGWQITMNYQGRFRCGGSLINNLWVLTAAHCTVSTTASQFDIIIGAHNRVSMESWARSVKVSKVINHAQYNPSTMLHDISMLKLASSVAYSNYIVPACLSDGSVDYSDKQAVVTGWGSTSSGGSVSTVLMQVTVKFLTNTRCSQKYGTHNPQFACCGGDNGVYADTCQGDSGGPMVNYHGAVGSFSLQNRWVQTGITSWGYGCGDGGVYTRVSAYVNNGWITSTMSQN